MKKLSANEVRQLWYDFFQQKNHLLIESKPLVPQNDDSLLWINSGVAALKDYFIGKKIPPSKRLVNSQKALRTNDIENVGQTSRHHTLFEMLGNFSIGDYFKLEAIDFAFEFLTKWLELDPEKLYITYYDSDFETLNKWKNLGFPENRLIPGGKKTNFWDLGQGPCGPCTEIYFDRGEKFDARGDELIRNDIENDRFIEIWNIVFSEFNNDGAQNYSPLMSKNIDTGAGFERIVSILQNGPTNYDTDLFLPIIVEIQKYTNFKYDIENYFKKDAKQAQINKSFRLIADHIRAISAAVNDGVMPSNLHRGYIIRRLIRRAYWNGKKLGISEEFLHKLVPIVAKTLNANFDIEKIESVIYHEEKNFIKTLEIGHELLENEIKKTEGQISPEIVFKLFVTYGFPPELTQEILQEKNISFDLKSLEEYREKHAQISRANIKKGMGKVIDSLNQVESQISEFVGYEFHKTETKIAFLANQFNEIDQTNEGEISYAIFEKTPFYATAGGQKHDQGYIIQGDKKIEILDVFKDKFLNNVHVFEGKLSKNLPVILELNSDNRLKLERNHSATHLLFASLRAEFGPQIKQLGSDNNEERLTFDFPCAQKPSKEQIKSVENRVNSYISQQVQREYLVTDLQEAQKLNAIMTLEESEYMDPNALRLVVFPGITTDLCGGTHIQNTKLLEKFTILSCQTKGSGIYRIRAVSSFAKNVEFLKQNIELLKFQISSLVNKIAKISQDFTFDFPSFTDLDLEFEHLTKIEEELKEKYKKILKNQDISQSLELNSENFVDINQNKFYIDLEFNSKNLKQSAATFRQKNPKSTFILATNLEDENYLITVASFNLESNVILEKIMEIYDGAGGGNSKIAQAKIKKKPIKDDIIKLLWALDPEF
ncbi:alanine--tRNA ligase [Mesomycoplasma ovipneumoniae]|uniref:alanine--tRNA ligase n=1 Tax=Mesomycoplasma ovipneumoniae TaxID=29562 RepID=UPI00311ABECF